MNKYLIHLVLFCGLLSPFSSSAQTITYGFINKVVTSSSVRFDVTLSSTSSFKLGSGQVYFNYNTAAFGTSAHTGGRIKISYPTGAVLGQEAFPGFGIYGSFTSNDNTSSRFSFFWQQAASSGAIPADNITTTPAVLFRVEIDFIIGGSSQPDNLCFESGAIFDDQTFTACGPDSGGANCGSFPGIQLTDDVYDCSGAALPVELLGFDARSTPIQQVELNWQTESEFNNDYFAIERSRDGLDFKEISRMKGAGTYIGPLDYKTLDQHPFLGDNYYRLRQVDFDGTTAYSEIRHVFLEQSTVPKDIKVYPNPTDSWLQLDFTQPLEQDGHLELYNLAGQVIQSYDLREGTIQQELNVLDLAKGTYLLRVHMDGQYRTQKIVVQ